jgi:hypothetical protein
VSNAALASNYLFCGPLLEQRLRESLPGTPVEGIEDLAQAGAEDARQRALFVLWDGDRFGDTALSGRAQIVTQRWLVLLYQRHASPTQRDARAQAAGPVLSTVHQAVAGWAPEGAHRAFKRGPGRAPSYTKASGLFPLTFEIDLTL